MNTMEIEIEQIEIADGHRRMLVETIAEIATSIEQIGLISPIAVRLANGHIHLIAGRQRLEAYRKLKRPTIRAIVFDDDEVKAKIRELDENLCRGELSPAEEAEAAYNRKQMWEALHPETKHGAAPAKREKGSKGGKAAKLSTLPSYSVTAAKATGKNERTIRREVRRGAELGDRILGKIKGTSLDKNDEFDAMIELKDMAADDGNQVVTTLAARAAAGDKVSAKTELGKIKRSRRERDLAEKIGLAAETIDEALYGIILTDPPWSRETWSEAGKSRDPSNHYATQSEEYLANMPMPAADDCILFMWSTQEHLDQAMRLIEAWGFIYKSGAVWVKPKISTGYWFRTQHELLLVATKGNPVAPAPGTQISSVFEADVGRHSEKPPIIHEMIERLWPTTDKLEMFARRARPGWALLGAEAPEDPANDDEAA